MYIKRFNKNDRSFDDSPAKSAADQISLADFDQMDGNHIFSENYQIRKNSLLDGLSDQPAYGQRRLARTAAVLLLFLLIGSSTAMAASMLYRMHLEQKDYRALLHVHTGTPDSTAPTDNLSGSALKSDGDSFKHEDSSSNRSSASASDNFSAGTCEDYVLSIGEAGSSDLEHPWMRLVFSYLPDGIEMHPGDFSKYGNPNEDTCGISADLTLLDVDGDIQFSTDYVVSAEEFSAGGHSAYLLHRKVENEYDKMLYVLFEQEHCMACALLGCGITNDEAKQIADGLSLEPAADAQTATTTWSYAQTLREQEEMQKEDHSDDLQVTPYACEASSCLQIGDAVPAPFITDSGVTVTIEKAEIRDSLEGLDHSLFRTEHLHRYVDEHWNLLPDERRFYTEADGIHSLPELIQTTQVNRKFVYLTVRVKNSGKSHLADFGAYYSMEALKETADHKLTWNTDADAGMSGGAPYYFDASLTDGNSSHFLYTSILAGETKTFHLGYFVDEDLLDQMYLELEGVFSDSPKHYVDIRNGLWQKSAH